MKYPTNPAEIIDAIDTLIKKVQDVGNKKKNIDPTNPIMEIITPEWYYSESYRVFENNCIEWKKLDEIEFIREMSEIIQNVDNELRLGIEFEKTFCCWYESYHYHPRTKWGIHIRYSSWLKAAAEFNKSCPTLISKPLDSVKAAFLYLFNHGLFHHLIDNATSMMEIISGKPDLYLNYLSRIYTQVFNSSDCIEEAIANAFLFGMADECHIDKQYLEKELSKQGPGFKDFVQYQGSDFLQGIRRILSQILHGEINIAYPEPIEQILDVQNPIGYYHGQIVPIWVHQRAGVMH